MPTEPELQVIRDKADAIIEAITAMPPKDRTTLISKTFGENYNLLLELAKKADPTVAQSGPPSGRPDTRGYWLEKYVDIHAYTLEIAKRFPEEPPMGTMG